MEEKKDMIPVETDSQSADTENSPSGDANEDPKQQAQENEDPKEHSIKPTTVIIGVLTIFVLMMGYFIWKTDISKDKGVEDAQTVMMERSAPLTKAKQLDPTKVYKLSSAADSYNGLSLSVTKVQFRQDVTRLWVKIDNDSGKNISMMPSANAKLVDNNGHSYKVDSFGGDQTSSIAPGAHEEVLVAFEPIRTEAKSLTFSLDSVFDMKHTAWNYSVQFDIP